MFGMFLRHCAEIVSGMEKYKFPLSPVLRYACRLILPKIAEDFLNERSLEKAVPLP